jgi:hypothetical protein
VSVFKVFLRLDGVDYTITKDDDEDIAIQLDAGAPNHHSPDNAMLLAQAIIAAVKDHD